MDKKKHTTDNSSSIYSDFELRLSLSQRRRRRR